MRLNRLSLYIESGLLGLQLTHCYASFFPSTILDQKLSFLPSLFTPKKYQKNNLVPLYKSESGDSRYLGQVLHAFGQYVDDPTGPLCTVDALAVKQEI